MTAAGTFLGCIALAFCLWIKLAKVAEGRKQPPGPPSIPFIGHTFQVPTYKTWKYFESLCHRYGPIFRLSLAGDEIVVLNKGKDAEILLGQRSKNYSSRKSLVFAGKYQSNTKRMVLLPYGETLRKHRAAIHHMLQPRAVGGYDSVVESESRKWLVNILENPTEIHRHTSRFAASLMFTLVYGKKITPENESDLDGVLGILDNFSLEEKGNGNHRIEIDLYGRLVLEVKNKMEKGDMTESCISRIWEQQKTAPNPLDLEEVCYVGGAATEAGTDTTAGSITWLMMALILYPDTLRKAQNEIDQFFTGSNILPDFSHMKHLPYCSAIVKEAFRWGPAAPGGFPHLSDEDDEYNGYLIKRGTMVIPCTWTMHHDEEEFPESYTFKPERWLEKDGASIHEKLADGHYLFGFGRRKCPGVTLAASTVWIAAVRLIWAFDIGPAYDKTGKPIDIHPDNCTSGMTSAPLKFPMSVRPRSQDRVALITRN